MIWSPDFKYDKREVLIAAIPELNKIAASAPSSAAILSARPF